MRVSIRKVSITVQLLTYPTLIGQKRGKKGKEDECVHFYYYLLKSTSSYPNCNSEDVSGHGNLSNVFSELNSCWYFFCLKMSSKGSNPQKLIIGIVFRRAAGTQGEIHSSKYKFLPLNGLSMYFFSLPKIKKKKKRTQSAPNIEQLEVNSLSSGSASFPTGKMLSPGSPLTRRHLQAM